MNTPRLRELLRPGRIARSLRFKSTVAVASFLVMISVLLSGLFVVYVERGEEEQVLRTAEEWSVLLSEAVAEGVDRNDPERFGTLLSTLRRDPRIAYLVVHGRDGELAAWTERRSPDFRDRLRAEAPADYFHVEGKRLEPLEDDGTPILDVVVPVHRPAGAAADDERDPDRAAAIGSVRFGFDLRPSQDRIQELRGRIVVSTLAMIGLGMLGTLFLVGTIVGPIQDLARATERIAEGDFDIRMAVPSEDELGTLTRSFNRMTTRLRHAQEQQSSWSRDLEERVREKTREIESTREHLADIVENVGASVLVADLDGTIVSANTQTMHIFGTKPEWTVGRHLDEFTCDPNHRLDTLLPMLESTRGPVVYEAQYEARGVETMDLLITHTLLRDPAGNPGGVLQISKDVTPLKRMEHRLLTTERLTAMGEMAGEIGHELNNYLMAIGGRAELIPIALDRGPESASLEQVRKSAEIITRQVAEMRTLTDGLLESARKETSPRDLELNDVVLGTVEFVRPQNRYDLIRLETEFAREELPVFADPQQIRQVLLNLLSNAADAVLERNPEGGVVRVASFRDGERVGFRVSDDGKGIDEATRRRIFEPHFTTKEKGHGFGLAVCHRVVTNHGGRISVESSPGRGTTFTVDLERLPRRSGAASASSSP
jgi:PAS domain S-box-containing protein